MPTRLDVAERWPDLFAGLTSARRRAVLQALAGDWHEGWRPDRADVADITDLARGTIDHAAYLRRADERAERLRTRPATGHLPRPPAAGSPPTPPDAEAGDTESDFDGWEAYFWPETYDPRAGQGTLRNLLGERDEVVLHAREFARGRARQMLLYAGDLDVARTFDAEHVQAIHRLLFAETYPWAGRYRSVDMFKGYGPGFASVHTGEIQELLAQAHRLVTGTDRQGMGAEEFAAQAAVVFAMVNHAHPFREGNGRASKVFVQHVAERSPFDLDFTRVGPRAWNRASALSGPDLESTELHPEELVPVFRAVTVPRAAG